MSSALVRYANPNAELGHAGPTAPIHADARLEFAADLPRFTDSRLAAADGFRASLLQRDREQLVSTNRVLRETLAELLLMAGRAARTPADDQVIERATRVLTPGGLLV